MNPIRHPQLRTIPEERLMQREGPYQVWETEDAYQVRTSARGRLITSGHFKDLTVTHIAVRECERRVKDWFTCRHNTSAGECSQDSEN